MQLLQLLEELMVSLPPACRRSAAGVAVLSFAALWPTHSGHAQTAGSTFVAGSRELFALDLASVPSGSLPKGIRTLRGKLSVVTKDGAPMLKASEPAEFLVSLPEALPEAFTLEFDIIPKACCNPSDLEFEGTPASSRSPTSANVEWHPQTVYIVGGGAVSQTPMPQDLAEILPSAMTHVNVNIDAGGLKLYTNDRLITTLPGRKFAHGRVLRVALGGQDDDRHAVYLGRLRIGAGGAPNTILGSTAPTANVSNNTSPTGVISNTAMQAGAPLSGLTVTVTTSAAGPLVGWQAVPRATGYAVKRWKLDDIACCNNASGTTFTAASPWQDKPLPMSGTYVYRVTANTPVGQLMGEAQFGFRMPEVGSGTTAVTPVLVAPTTTGTITPMEPTKETVTERPGSLNVSAGPVPTNLRFISIPNRFRFGWDAVSGASYYKINRAPVGSATWTPLVSEPYPVGTYLLSGPPDPTKTYTYQVVAVQADGRLGAATIDFKTPTLEPTNLTATSIAPGQVRLEWDNIQTQFDSFFRDGSRTTYFLAGPGTGAGITVVGSSTSLSERNSYTLTGVPAGSQTWTLTVDWNPGGIITPSSSWTKVTATVPAVAADPLPRYRLVALGFKAIQQAKDIDDAHDGHGDEVYFSAIVNRTRLTGLPLPVTKGANLTTVMTRSHGDEAVSVPYGRIKSGTASPTGGIQSGDIVPANLDLAAATGTFQSGTFPLLIWEGELADSDAVVVHPTLWEDDVNPVVQATWAKAIFDLAAIGYAQTDPPTTCGACGDGFLGRVAPSSIATVIDYLSKPHVLHEKSEYVANASFGELAPAGNRFFECNVWIVYGIRRPCETHGVDRPIGLLADYGFPEAKAAERIVLLTRSTLDVALGSQKATSSVSAPAGYTSPQWAPGTFVFRLRDVAPNSKPGTDVNELESHAIFELYLRVERMR
jgi:hypothetical protein